MSKSKLFSATKIRKPIQIISAVVIFGLLQIKLITIAMIIVAGSAIGVIFGKVFCRWMCPMGLIMEMMTGIAPDDKAKSLYQYHKLGCPIAWISGILNHISIFTVKRNSSKECKDCGLCDKACYISKLNNSFSLFKKDKKNPVDSYTCSRCMACVDSCPTGYLSYGTRNLLGTKKQP